jgi:hypothetical protein
MLYNTSLVTANYCTISDPFILLYLINAEYLISSGSVTSNSTVVIPTGLIYV